MERTASSYAFPDGPWGDEGLAAGRQHAEELVERGGLVLQREVLEHVEHNKARAASLLGISRTSLWRILKKEAVAETPEAG